MNIDTKVSRETSAGLFVCSKCGGRHSRFRGRGRPASYCEKCHAAWMRQNRPRHRDMTDEQKKKANARRHAGMCKTRGSIEEKPCKECGDPNAQMHHEDYDKPTSVIWLCRRCHLAHHRIGKNTITAG